MEKLTKPVLSPLPKFKSSHNFRNSHLSDSTLTAIYHPPPLHRHDSPLLPSPSLTLTVSLQNRHLPMSEGRGKNVVAFSHRSLNIAAASSTVSVAASSSVFVAASSKILAGLSRSMSISFLAIRRSSFPQRNADEKD
ncbi:uncharacterized protein DS421_18g614130 [Arachis hypogaea]|nr:uncharacterized protein DS421_18g614130 [Arachis hypogaea]